MNKQILQIISLPRKWVLKHKDGSYIEPHSTNSMEYNLCMKYEADAFRYTFGEANDMIEAFPQLKYKCDIIQVTR